jgi:ubiquitin C-terminal hydrolase
MGLIQICFKINILHTHSYITYELKYPALLGIEDKVKLLPTNGLNNVTNCTCFNCCVLKLLGNSATNEKQLHATPNLVGIG